MSDISGSESGSEYLPGASEEEDSDDSDFSDIEFDSDEEFSDEPEPLVEDGWRFMSDPFSDARPDFPATIHCRTCFPDILHPTFLFNSPGFLSL